jgi:hypothetical protein
VPGFWIRSLNKELKDMLKLRIVLALLLAAGLLVGGAVADESLKSGPQVGKKVPGPFHPLNVTGEKAGEKFCLYCKNGEHPVAMIFARNVSAPLTELIKKVDACTAKHSKCEMGSFVVFLSDSEGLEKTLKGLADKEKIKTTILAIDNPAGPKGYQVSNNAEVTVVLYTDRTVKANHSFKKGELKKKDIEAIVADIKKILPKEE